MEIQPFLFPCCFWDFFLLHLVSMYLPANGDYYPWCNAPAAICNGRGESRILFSFFFIILFSRRQDIDDWVFLWLPNVDCLN